MSASKRMNLELYNERFNRTPQEQAEEFISKIDFSRINDTTLETLKAKLFFVKKLKLNKININQLKHLIDES